MLSSAFGMLPSSHSQLFQILLQGAVSSFSTLTILFHPGGRPWSTLNPKSIWLSRLTVVLLPNIHWQGFEFDSTPQTSPLSYVFSNGPISTLEEAGSEYSIKGISTYGYFDYNTTLLCSDPATPQNKCPFSKWGADTVTSYVDLSCLLGLLRSLKR